MSIGIALDVLNHWTENKKVISKPVVDATKTATDWMRDRANDVSHGMQTGYQEMVAEATSWLKQNSPEFAKESIDTLGQGYGKIGGKILSFLDPVAYGIDIAADVADSAVVSPLHLVDNLVDTVQGRKSAEEGLKEWGRTLADSFLTQTEVAATVVPAGHIAGKAAKKPLQVAKKEIKKSLKATSDITERKALKHDLHVNRVKRTAGVSFAKNSARAARQLARDGVIEMRGNTRPDSKVKLNVPHRDWGALEDDLRVTWNQPLKEVETWNRNRWKRK